MSAVYDLFASLPRFRARGDNDWIASCPCSAHANGDSNPSLSGKHKDGKWLLHCFFGCDLTAILAALGITTKDLRDDHDDAGARSGGNRTNGSGALNPIVATYPYTDEHGKLLFESVRFQPKGKPKHFRQRHPDGRGGWIWNLEGVRRVLYRLPELLHSTSDEVWITEGEKCADAVAALGMTATTAPMGAIAPWSPEYTQAFKPEHRVTLLADNDPPGRNHMQEVAKDLYGKVKIVKILELPGLPPKGDVVDWLHGKDPDAAAEELSKLSEGCQEWKPERIRSPLNIIRLSDVQPEDVCWVWRDRIASGKICLFIGDPGTGKSTLSLDIASRISKGGAWPYGGSAPLGNIFILSAEDGLADTIRPRVDLHGGNPESVYVVQSVTCKDHNRPFNLALDIDHLESDIAGTENVRLVIIDPLSAYLGEKDSYKDSEIRAILAPLAALAERRKVAVVGISHMGKSEQRKALYRALGSIAFVAAARTVFAVGVDKDDKDRRIFVPVKNNLARNPPALAFRISAARVLEWEPQPLEDVDADSVLSGGIPEDGDERRDASELLQTMLKAGELPARDVLKAANENGIADRTLKRAKSRLGVRARHEGQPGKAGQWFWSLPDLASTPSLKEATSSPKGAILKKVAPFEQTIQAIPFTSASSSKDATALKVAPFGEEGTLRDRHDSGEDEVEASAVPDDSSIGIACAVESVQGDEESEPSVEKPEMDSMKRRLWAVIDGFGASARTNREGDEV